MHDHNNELLTPSEVCKLLNIKISTLRAAIFKRKISFIKVGRLVRFRSKDVDSYISKNTKEAIM